MDAVVVTDTLDWKLHGFDLLSEHSLPVSSVKWCVLLMLCVHVCACLLWIKELIGLKEL